MSSNPHETFVLSFHEKVKNEPNTMSDNIAPEANDDHTYPSSGDPQFQRPGFQSEFSPHFHSSPTSPKHSIPSDPPQFDNFSFSIDQRPPHPHSSHGQPIHTSFPIQDHYSSHIHGPPLPADPQHDPNSSRTGSHSSAPSSRQQHVLPMVPPRQMLGYPQHFSSTSSLPHSQESLLQAPIIPPQVYMPQPIPSDVHPLGELGPDHFYECPSSDMYPPHAYPAELTPVDHNRGVPLSEDDHFSPPKFNFGRALSLDNEFTSTYSSNDPSPYAMASDDADFSATAPVPSEKEPESSKVSNQTSPSPSASPQSNSPVLTGPSGRRAPERKKRNSVPTGEAAARSRCPICKKQFKRPSSMQTHIYSHTGQKCFKCPWEGCGREFNVKSNMTRHYKLHERDERRST
ncbi:hypothetical protein PGUG_01805 [Meyerozyma guilliermondii ATCC 6260]|uniref:C2H2-type domain-containing protein n=1 Tax=Meyerozyma guilliermondii (strain ATCC 6260 / CBS 566 / DSM 6381 / JCM 1539 / NBRC 10279 / NRRL Y-324) TaxID=294746 RepID=A5DEV4_PICGU|nr:uncharacterized protein PGUG_01805 [Meyerozyma guilliermondii ATCC 6260]EDK37707.2 hypothetical protein PGUG_01805 [Meyerozyma guilliermondii ATCC 6260]